MALISSLLFLIFSVIKFSNCIWNNTELICNKCDCTEPHVNCFDKNISKIDFGIPNDTDIVNLSRNFIKDIHCNISWPLSVIDIDLSRNLIIEINPCAFQEFTLLESLNLSHNYLEYLNPRQFSNLTNLNSLDVSNNKLRVLDQWFEPRNNLMRLNLANNPLGKQRKMFYFLQFSVEFFL